MNTTDDAQGQRPLLVRQRQEVQALPQGRDRPHPPGASAASLGPRRDHRPHYAETGAPEPATSRWSRMPTPSSACAAPGGAAEILPRWGPRSRPASPPTSSTRCHRPASSRGGYPSPLNYRGFPKSVCTSVNEVICHGIPDDRALREGDIVNIDVTIFRDGVHGDTNATFLVGKVDAGVEHWSRHAGLPRSAASRPVRPGPAHLRHRAGHRGRTPRPAQLRVVRAFIGHGVGDRVPQRRRSSTTTTPSAARSWSRA